MSFKNIEFLKSEPTGANMIGINLVMYSLVMPFLYIWANPDRIVIIMTFLF